MKKRIISAIIMLVIVIPLLIMGGFPYSLAVGLIACMAYKEIIDLRHYKLNEYLHNIDTTVMEKVQKLITELAEKDNINEQLKENNQMLWVSKMNNIKNIAEEIILKEYIYV